MSRICRYPATELRGDYIRAAVGLALTVLPLIATWGSRTAAIILSGLALVFIAFALERKRVSRVPQETLHVDGRELCGFRNVVEGGLPAQLVQ